MVADTYVMGLFDDDVHADRALDSLRARAVKPDDISIAVREHDRFVARRADDDDANRTAAGMAGGATLGGVAGLLVGIGALAIPGIGPVLAAGPLAAGLGGAALGAGLGAAAGGFLGALSDIGLDNDDAQAYAESVASGSLLMVVGADAARAPEIEAALREAGANNVRVTRARGDTDFVVR